MRKLLIGGIGGAALAAVVALAAPAQTLPTDDWESATVAGGASTQRIDASNRALSPAMLGLLASLSPLLLCLRRGQG